MFQEYTTGDAWVAQLVKHLPSAQVHDPRDLESSPASGSLLSGEPASPSACRSPLLVLSLSLGKKNLEKKRVYGSRIGKTTETER